MTDALLSPGDPDPVIVLNPGGPSDFFLTGDHAGRAIPRKLGRLGVPDSEMERHIAWDIGIAGVIERLSASLDATAVSQAYSRLVIDCNRDPSWPSAMPTVSEYTPVPGNEALSDADKQARIDAIFTPYHDRIRALLDARNAAGRRTIFLAMHSFTPEFKGMRRGMHCGVLFHRDIRFSDIVLRLLRDEPDIVVGANEPYAITDNSDYSAPEHATKRGLLQVEIEIRQDLIADPAGQAAWAERFDRVFKAALEVVDRG